MIKVALFIIVSLALASAKTIQWTNAGGNPLWDFANNWDCLCIPTINDDVIINLSNIPGRVNIGSAAAFARSLTVGGSSSFSQTILIQNSLTLGVGGGKILSNGAIQLNSAPNQPFYSAGVFDGGSYFDFISGTLGGQFTFTNVNFSSSAAKNINGTTTVTGIVVADLPVGTQGLISVSAGTFQVMGTLKSFQTLTIAANPGAKFSVPGTVDFQGSVSTTLTIRGTTLITTLNIAGGIVILNDDVTVTTAAVASSATITMIGANTVNRVFSDISGQGTVNIQGGTNTFHTMSNVNSVVLTGGILVADTKQCNIATLTQTGGSIQGTATISASSASFANAVINNTPVTAVNLELKGFTNINGGTLTVTGLGIVSASSQLTLGSNALFAVSKNAKVSQGSPLQILPSGTAGSSAFQNDGKWTSTSTLTLDLLTRGAGGYELGSGASITATGITFSCNSIVLTSAQFNSIGSTVTVATIDGSAGLVNSQSQTFNVTGNLNVATYQHKNGISNIAGGMIGNLDVQTGNLVLTGTSLTVNALTFEGGLITSGSMNNIITASSTSITTNMPKTISQVTVSSASITLQCGAAQCQLLTLNSKLTTSPSF